MKTNYLLLLLLALVVVFVFFKMCTVKCKMPHREGYIRSTLGNVCQGLQRTPVDYAMKLTDGWQRNPHWQVNPSVEYQPLEFGPIDFYKDTRRLNKYGHLFQQYDQNWMGCGKELTYLRDDEKNRSDLVNVGDVGVARQMDDMDNPAILNSQYALTEMDFLEPSSFQKLYGGPEYLKNVRLGQ